MINPRLLVYAARTARPRQLRARLVRPLARRRFPVEPTPRLEPTGAAELWRSPAFDAVRFAGSGRERLRGFHESYGDDALQHARNGDAAAVRRTLEDWIARTPPRHVDAWHPYPLSTRVGNWVAALALEPSAATTSIETSLWRQLLHLERNIEEDILGNHLIRNARALVLGGVGFGSERLLSLGLALLERELPEQILPDGGHYERSPAYHLLVLRDLCEIDSVTSVPDIRSHIGRMRRFAAALARPDGRPALFNDGGLDLAPALDLPPVEHGLAVFPETGYAVLRTPRVWLAFDCGPPSPPFLPAHAHADALSFQLWVDGRAVVVDPGAFTYEPGADRDWFRGTRAHSTVAIDGDQFELWGAFRSGPLPRVELLEASATELVAAVTGRTGVRHERRVSIDTSELVVTDRIGEAGRRTIESSLPFAPEASPIADAHGAAATVERRRVSERFFKAVDAPALVVREERALPTELGWTIPLR